MIRILGYSNGRRIVEDLGPGVARIQGRNGSALSGSYVVTKPIHHLQRKPDGRRHATKYDDVPRCGVTMKQCGEPCGRVVGHGDAHRSRSAMTADNERRRKVYAE